MSLEYADRVKETTDTTGTGTYDLEGAQTGFQSFVTSVGTTNECKYTVTDGTDWEVGRGVVTDAAPDTLSRGTILDSSNSGSAVSWSAGSKDVFLTFPAADIQGVASAWVVFDGTIATPVPISSYNVSDIVDLGTGDYEVTVVNVDIASSVANGSMTSTSGRMDEISLSRTASRIAVKTFKSFTPTDNTAVATDSPLIAVTVFGGRA